MYKEKLNSFIICISLCLGYCCNVTYTTCFDATTASSLGLMEKEETHQKKSLLKLTALANVITCKIGEVDVDAQIAKEHDEAYEQVKTNKDVKVADQIDIDKFKKDYDGTGTCEVELDAATKLYIQGGANTSVAIPQFMENIQKSLYGTVRFTVPATWCLTVVGRKMELPGRESTVALAVPALQTILKTLVEFLAKRKIFSSYAMPLTISVTVSENNRHLQDVTTLLFKDEKLYSAAEDGIVKYYTPNMIVNCADTCQGNAASLYTKRAEQNRKQMIDGIMSERDQLSGRKCASNEMHIMDNFRRMPFRSFRSDPIRCAASLKKKSCHLNL
uniref:Uncharacterized protein n=1 Tax=Timema cristinae TaxID=61476 RepID=A0A7R9CQH3_TIMCR|nr:unnamed protein product [Timema cristinae]